MKTFRKSAQNQSLSNEICSGSFHENRPFFTTNLSLKIPRNSSFFSAPYQKPWLSYDPFDPTCTILQKMILKTGLPYAWLDRLICSSGRSCSALHPRLSCKAAFVKEQGHCCSKNWVSVVYTVKLSLIIQINCLIMNSENKKTVVTWISVERKKNSLWVNSKKILWSNLMFSSNFWENLENPRI